MRYLALLLSLCLLGLLTPLRAMADGDARLAEALFDRARALMDAEKFNEACPLLAESQRLDPGGGTLVNLAICEERIGKLATAAEHYGAVIAQASREGRQDRVDLATERLASVKARVSRLAVEVPPGHRVRDLVVRLDGRSVPETAWGTPIPVDAGAHQISASAPTRVTFEHELVIAGEGAMETVTVPLLGVPPPPPPPERWRYGTASWVIGGVSSAVGVAATVLGVLALTTNGNVEGCNFETGTCENTAARDEARKNQDRALAFAWASTIGLAVGGAGFVVAIAIPTQRVPDPKLSKPVALSVGFQF